MKYKDPPEALAKRWRDFYVALGGQEADLLAMAATEPEEAAEAAGGSSSFPGQEMPEALLDEWYLWHRVRPLPPPLVDLKPDVTPFVPGDQHSVFEWVLAVFAGRDPHVYAASLGISLDKPEDESARRWLLYHLAKDVFLHLEEEIKAGAISVMRPAYCHDRVSSTERQHTRDALSREEVRKFAERGEYQEGIARLAEAHNLDHPKGAAPPHPTIACGEIKSSEPQKRKRLDYTPDLERAVGKLPLKTSPESVVKSFIKHINKLKTAGHPVPTLPHSRYIEKQVIKLQEKRREAALEEQEQHRTTPRTTPNNI
jgi:hypothetical protein